MRIPKSWYTTLSKVHGRYSKKKKRRHGSVSDRKSKKNALERALRYLERMGIL